MLRGLLATLLVMLCACAQYTIPANGHDFGSTSVVVSTPSAVADGTSSIDVVVTLKDADGTPIAGWNVALNASGTNNTLVQPADVSDANGQTHGSIASSAVGVKTIMAVPYQGTTQIAAPNNSVTVTFNLPAASLRLANVPGTTTAGHVIPATVTLLDANNLVVSDYLGVVALTTDDAHAVVPSHYTFTAQNAGTATISMAFGGAGTHALTATDVSNSKLTQTVSGVVVSAGAATQVSIQTSSATPTAGAPMSLTISATDAFGNAVSGFTDVVRFTSSDPNATLPTAYTFTGSNSQTFANVFFTHSGTQSITVIDSTTQTQLGIISVVVSPAATAALVVYAIPTTLAAGAVTGVSVRATDMYGNLTPSYTGTIGFTSSDTAATLPTSYTYLPTDKGNKTFNGQLVFKTTGTNVSVTATDMANASITGTESGITVNGASATTLAIAGLAASVTAGVANTVTVSAKDSFGNTVPTYLDGVHFTSSDTRSTLPPDYTFTTADHGVHTFTATLTSAGPQTLKATDKVSSGINATVSTTVVGGAATSLSLGSVPSTVANGQVLAVVVSLYDAYSNPATYTGTVTFSSSDASALLPTSYTYVAGDAGIHTFNVAFHAAGAQTFTVKDTLNTALKASASVTVQAGGAANLVVSGFPTNPNAGDLGAVIVKAIDSNSNVVPTYAGTVTFSSSDAQAALPARYTFVGSDNGAHTFTAVALKTVGTQSITATDVATAIFGSQAGISVKASAVAALQIVGSTAVTAGAATTYNVKAVDAYGNLAAGYLGGVHISSSDTAAVLPANYTFTAVDAGNHAFTTGITFKTAGTQSLTSTDAVTASITGSLPGIVVTAGNANLFVVNGLAASTASGTALSPVVTAYDVYNNLAKTYTGTAHFTSTDPLATVPANYAFTGSDAGVHTFTSQLILKTVGTQTLTATDVVTATLKGTSAGVAVSAGSAATLAVTGIPTPATACAPATMVVTAHDASNNVSPTYVGTVHFVSSDTTATVPANYSFTLTDAGSHTFAAGVTLKKAPATAVTVTATDTVTASITGVQSVNTVNSAASAFVVVNLGGGAAGVVSSPIATIKDTCGNTVPTYVGTVAVTSTDAHATLPSNTPFTAADAGVHTFVNGVTLTTTAAASTVTITDTTTATVKGTSNAVAVTPAGINKFSVTSGTPTAGTALNVTVTAQDPYANTVTGYVGAVSFSSSDAAVTYTGTAPNAPLYTFTAADNGVHAFTNGVTLKTSGSQTIGVRDPVSGSTGSAAVTVGPAAAILLKVTGLPSPVVAGTPAGFTVAAYDAYTNLATGYVGTVTFTTAGDALSAKPVNYAFTAGDAGAHTFLSTAGVTLKTPGNQTFTAADTVTSTITGNQNVAVTGVTAISSGGVSYHTCMATAGGTKCWGDGVNGQLGLGDTSTRGTTAASMGSSLPYLNLGAGRTATSLHTGGNTSCAVLDNGTVSCWGINTSGQIGDGNTTQITSPSFAINLGAGRTVSTTATQPFAQNANHTCAIMDNGNVTCWGLNAVGQLGLGTLVTASAPTATSALTLNTSATAIAAGLQHTCVILNTNNVECWGLATQYETGNNSATNSNKPTAVTMPTGRTALALAAGSDHTCAIMDNQNIACWGNFPGNGGAAVLRVPTALAAPVAAVTATVKAGQAIVAGTQFTCIIVAGGNVQCWGLNSTGQCGGSGTATPVTAAASVAFAPGAAGRTAIALSAGAASVCALLDNGQVSCWGQNTVGQLGLGDTTTRTAPSATTIPALW